MNTPLPKTLWPFIWHFVKRYPLPFTVFACAPFFLIFETTIQPYAIKLIIDTIAQNSTVPAIIPEAIIVGAWIYVGSFAIEMGVFRIQEFWQTRVIPIFLADIRMSVIQQLSQQSYVYFTNQMSGNLATKISDLPMAIDAIRLHLCWSILSTVGVVLATIIVVATVSLPCAGLMMFWVVVHLAISLSISRRVDIAASINAEDKSQLSGGVIDMLANIIPIKLFARRGFEMSHIQKIQHQEKQSNKVMLTTVCVMRFFIDVMVILLMAGVISLLVYGWHRGMISPGDVAFVMLALLAMITQLWYLAQNMMDFFRQIGVAKQALSLLSVPVTVKDAPDASILKVPQGMIEFDEVTFQYHDGRSLFLNKSLTIQAGTKVGLVGYSGSGKTSFVHLILRFFDVINGKILIDGQNISQVTQDSLHENIVMVPQDTTLFHRSLKDNIAYGNPDASETQIIQAAHDAHCHEFIMALPEGYETLVGDRGIKLSGGQRQRIAIARAMLKPAPILIMDEATSALDSVTEKYIQESLHRVMQNRTTIVVAHRLSTLAEMDRILVFDNGHIIEDGSHDELLTQNGHYAHMWHMQAGGFLPDHA